jgi:hypothetical protein
MKEHWNILSKFFARGFELIPSGDITQSPLFSTYDSISNFYDAPEASAICLSFCCTL